MYLNHSYVSLHCYANSYIILHYKVVYLCRVVSYIFTKQKLSLRVVIPEFDPEFDPQEKCYVVEKPVTHSGGEWNQGS